jgi:hypothetical protein
LQLVDPHNEAPLRERRRLSVVEQHHLEQIDCFVASHCFLTF